MNKIFVIGRLINDPEQHITQNGVHQSKIVIADNKSKDETNFFNCIAWRNQATYINTYLHKGDMVAITGKLNKIKYPSKSGGIVYDIQIIIDEINTILSSKKNNSNSSEVINKMIDNEINVNDIIRQDIGNDKNISKKNNVNNSTDDEIVWPEDDLDGEK